MEAELSIRCETLGGINCCFWIQIFDECHQMVACCPVEAWNRIRFKLHAGHYTLRVSQCAGLNPGQIIKWVQLTAGDTCSLCFLFSQPLCHPMAVPVCFTVTDANYPGITDLNGGITIWRTTP